MGMKVRSGIRWDSCKACYEALGEACHQWCSGVPSRHPHFISPAHALTLEPLARASAPSLMLGPRRELGRSTALGGAIVMGVCLQSKRHLKAA
eukprot:1161865-Pelagomonas_calceolata.AAC.11